MDGISQTHPASPGAWLMTCKAMPFVARSVRRRVEREVSFERTEGTWASWSVYWLRREGGVGVVRKCSSRVIRGGVGIVCVCNLVLIWFGDLLGWGMCDYLGE